MITFKHPTDHYKVLKNNKAVLYILVRNNLQDLLLFSKKTKKQTLQWKTMHTIRYHCIKLFEMNVSREKKISKKEQC